MLYVTPCIDVGQKKTWKRKRRNESPQGQKAKRTPTQKQMVIFDLKRKKGGRRWNNLVELFLSINFAVHKSIGTCFISISQIYKYQLISTRFLWFFLYKFGFRVYAYTRKMLFDWKTEIKSLSVYIKKIQKSYISFACFSVAYIYNAYCVHIHKKAYTNGEKQNNSENLNARNHRSQAEKIPSITTNEESRQSTNNIALSEIIKLNQYIFSLFSFEFD